MNRPRRQCLGVLLLLAWPGATGAGPGQLKKPYFTATAQGASARYQSVDGKGDITEEVMTRLPDEDGRVAFEYRAEYKTGQFKGTKLVNVAVMRAGFPMATDGLDYMRWVERFRGGSGDTEVTEMDADTVKAIVSSAVELGPVVVFKGAETIDGRACDHYTYAAGKGPMARQGELWLSDQVPFAKVREIVHTKDATGAAVNYETRLVEVGTASATAGKAGLAAAAPTLADAYKGEKVSILVDVVAGTARVGLTITNKGDKKVTVRVPKGVTSLDADSPVHTLLLVAEAERTIDLGPGATAARFEVTQQGAYRPTKGTFTISVYEGQPLFSGSVEMGYPKK
jgi:hypothetical protein